MKFTTRKSIISYMLNLIRKSQLSLANLLNFYVEHHSSGYILHTSKPMFKEENNLESGLKFYLQNIRK